MQTTKISQISISPSSTLLFCLKKMDSIRRKLLLVIEEKKYIGLLSIGDIQRAIIKNVSLTLRVDSIMRNDYITAKKTNSIDEIKKLMIQIRSEFMPIIDDDNNLCDVYFWEDLFSEKIIAPIKQFNLPVVIMAGGIGSRLKPLTNVLPKPLIPIGSKTILEDIIERFSNHGCTNYYISVNYKSKLIKYYIQNQNLPYSVEYFEENKPLGTIGSLSLLKDKIKQTFFVSNCDIIIDQDYSEILDYHIASKNEVTLVAAMKTYPIAYGTIETAENGKLLKIIEKPELTFKINTGMYILEPHLLNEIPVNSFFHITQLIENVIKQDRKVGVFPVSEGSWKDIGDWKEYLKEIEQ